MKKNHMYLVTLFIVIMCLAGCATKTVSGEIVGFESNDDGYKSELLGVNVLLEDGEEVICSVDNLAGQAIESSVAWEYIYSSESPSVPSDIIIQEDKGLTFKFANEKEVVLKVGETFSFYADEDGKHHFFLNFD